MNGSRAAWVSGLLLAGLGVLIGMRACGDDQAGAASAPAVPSTAETGIPASASGSGGVADDSRPQVFERVAPSGVPLRLVRRPRLDIPSPPYGPHLAALQAASDAGDAEARYRLGVMLYQCRDVPEGEAALGKAVEELYQTRSRGGWDVSDPAQEEQTLRTAYDFCQGIPGPARTGYRELLKAAADAGVVEAQLNLMFYLPPGEYCQFLEDCSPAQVQRMAVLREEARSYVTRALEAGSVEALRTVGGWFLNEEMGTPDPVEAYAHFSAYDQIQQVAGRERELGAMLAGIRKRLRPVDLERAQSRAKELLANPRCCLLTR